MRTVTFVVNTNFDLIGDICVHNTILLAHELGLGRIRNADNQFYNFPQKVCHLNTIIMLTSKP